MNGMIAVGDGPMSTPADMDMAKNIAETLHKHYPDHLWAVESDIANGIATVRNLRLDGRWGFIFHLKDLVQDPMMKKVIMAGGELLERYRLARGKYDEDKYSQLHEDFAGRLHADK